MNILLTGSNGSIGKELKNYFIKKTNHKLYLPVRKKFKEKKNKRLNYFFCDLEKNINIKFKIEIIIHCASKDRQKSNSFKYTYKPNIMMTKNLIDFANKNSVKKIFFLSTMMVYKNFKKTKKIITENDYSNLDAYAKSKYKSETMFCNSNNFFKAICIRLPGVLTTSNNDGPILKKIIYNLKKNHDLKLFNLNKSFNNLTDSFEIFRFIKFCFKKRITNSVYQLASTKPMKFGNVIRLIQQKIKSKSKITKLSTKINSFTISTKKIEKDLNFKPSSTKNIILRYCNLI